MPYCNICEQTCPEDVERVSIRSNVRKFRDELFEVWRCSQCASIHAADEVDLPYYYADYPFHKLGGNDLDWMLKSMYRNLLKRLKAHGFNPEQSLLDYGCGSGHFLKLCRESGFSQIAGYDAYSEDFADASVLDTQYDLVMSQDVLEHVESPREHLETLGKLVRPGGLVIVGTPNASAIDLANPEPRVHTLHQPYHRHIASTDALKKMAADLGWALEEYYPTMYSNTRVPFVNTPFVTHYFKCFDDTVDIALEPVRVGSWKLWNPATLWLGLFGSYFAPESDVMAVFSLPKAQVSDM